MSALIIGLDDVFSLSGLQYYAFAQVYVLGGSGGLEQAWSLDIELTFYLVLPLFAALVARVEGGGVGREWRAVGMLSATGLLYAALAILVVGIEARATWFYSLPFYLAYFGVGMGLAVASAADRRPAPIRWLADRPTAAWTAGAVVYVLLAALPARPGELREGWLLLLDYVGGGIFGLLVVAPAALAPTDVRAASRSIVLRMLGSRPLILAGIVSYGIYLYHPLAYHLVGRAGIPVGGLTPSVLPVFVVTLVLSAISWKLVEEPAQRLGARWGRRPSPAPVQVVGDGRR